MNTAVQIFYDSGSCALDRLERKINETARENGLDIVSASPCFRKGLLDADTIFIVVGLGRKENDMARLKTRTMANYLEKLGVNTWRLTSNRRGR